MRFINILLIWLLACGPLINCKIPSEGPPSAADKKADTITSATRALFLPCQITERFTYEALHFDPSKQKYGKLSYRISKDAWIRVQVVLRKDPSLLIRTIVDWEKQEAGIQTLFWDGRDSSGHLVDKSQYPCLITIEADKEIHRTHDWSRCKELIVRLNLSKKVRVGENASLQVPFTIAASRSGYVQETGLTARLYIDFEKAVEETFSPTGERKYLLNLPFDSKILGEHLVTLVVSDGADHSGAVSRVVRFVDEE